MAEEENNERPLPVNVDEAVERLAEGGYWDEGGQFHYKEVDSATDVIDVTGFGGGFMVPHFKMKSYWAKTPKAGDASLVVGIKVPGDVRLVHFGEFQYGASTDVIDEEGFNRAMDTHIKKAQILRDAISTAVLAERERCVKIADSLAPSMPCLYGDPYSSYDTGFDEAKEAIAAKIRSGE